VFALDVGFLAALAQHQVDTVVRAFGGFHNKVC
jgi:hypothetical protein